MKKPKRKGSPQVRIYQEDFDIADKLAKQRVTSLGQIIHEWRIKARV